MSTIQLNGTQLEYIEQGTGEPVVLVHGTLGDYRSWDLQLDPFAKKFRTISYSRRYHYPNHCSGDESDYSAMLHANDLAELIANLGLESAHIVGNSYGAYTALFLAMNHPERVRTLVLSEAPVFPLIEHIPEGRSMRDDFLEHVWEPAGEVLKQGKMEKGVKTFVDGVVDDGAFYRFPKEIRDLITDNAREFKSETSSPDFWTPFSCDDAQTVTAPTLLLTGEKSVKMFQLIMEELDRCLPNSEYVKIPESSHELPSDNPSAYNNTVMDFLTKHSR